MPRFGFGIMIALWVSFAGTTSNAEGTHGADNPGHPKMIECHLQEGFYGHRATIELDGKTLKELTATTKLTLGLAEIVPFEAQNGEEVVVRLATEPEQTATISVDAAQPFIIVNFVDGALQITSTDQQPGYF